MTGQGAEWVGVYGRSIGGVTACHLARHHPEVVRLLIADRAMSTLESAAKHLYGDWAAKGLRLTSMTADNVENYWSASCHKVMICDPKDCMIRDAAALRTSVALRVLEEDAGKLCLPDEHLNELVTAWNFMSVVLLVCEDDAHDPYEERKGSRASSDASGSGTWQCDAVEAVGVAGSSSGGCAAGGGIGVAGSNDQNQPLLQAAFVGGGGSQSSFAKDASLVTAQWLEEQPEVVCAAMAPLIDKVRSAMDLVGAGFDGAGVTSGDACCDPGDPRQALQSLLANLQVWGAWRAEPGLDSSTVARLAATYLERMKCTRLPKRASIAIQIWSASLADAFSAHEAPQLLRCLTLKRPSNQTCSRIIIAASRAREW